MASQFRCNRSISVSTRSVLSTEPPLGTCQYDASSVLGPRAPGWSDLALLRHQTNGASRARPGVTGDLDAAISSYVRYQMPGMSATSARTASDSPRRPTHLKLGYGAAWCVPRHDLMWEVTATTDVCPAHQDTLLPSADSHGEMPVLASRRYAPCYSAEAMLHPHGIESRE
jgi:hypothetical protein